MSRDKLPFTLPHGDVPYIIFVFTGSFDTTRRQHGLCFLQSNTIPLFFSFLSFPSFALLARPIVPDLPGSWRMSVCVDVASCCQHELCKAADTAGMQSMSVCAPQCMGNCGRLLMVRQSAFLLYIRQLPNYKSRLCSEVSSVPTAESRYITSNYATMIFLPYPFQFANYLIIRHHSARGRGPQILGTIIQSWVVRAREGIAAGARG